MSHYPDIFSGLQAAESIHHSSESHGVHSQRFWKMIYDRKCGVIVMLCDLVEDGEVQ